MKRACPLLTGIGGFQTDETRRCYEEDWVLCLGSDCQLWWFCSGDVFKGNVLNVDARIDR